MFIDGLAKFLEFGESKFMRKILDLSDEGKKQAPPPPPPPPDPRDGGQRDGGGGSITR